MSATTETSTENASNLWKTPTNASYSENGIDYRIVSRAAICSWVIALLGLTSLLFSVLLILPIAGLLLAISGWKTIQRYPLEYSGLNLAKYGVIANVALFVGSMATHVIVYVTEVDEGFERILFNELQPESLKDSNQIPKRAFELNKKPIFIKGYVHPSVGAMGKVKQFVLVPDMGTCCFGGQPKLTDMILVNTTEDARVVYRRTMVKLHGTFEVGNSMVNAGEIKGILYRMEATKSK
jgi:hypothetical protein